MHLSISSRRGRGGSRGIGRDSDRSPWPRGRAFELSCRPGGRDIGIFVRARDHKSFPGRGISVIFDLTFLPGGREFDSNFVGKCQNPALCPAVLGLYVFPIFKYLSKYFAQIYRAQYRAAMLMCHVGACNDVTKWW